jgi:hypothetical protein
MLPPKKQVLICIEGIRVNGVSIKEKIALARILFWIEAGRRVGDMKNQSSYSPEFADQRLTWLRKQNRLPLRQRFLNVLGGEGLLLLEQYRAAYLKAEGSSNAFDKRARAILRACSQITPERDGMRRRIAYVQACVIELAPRNIPIGLTEDEMEDVEESIRQPDPLDIIARKENVIRGVVWDRSYKLLQVFMERWPDDEERAVLRARRIITNAKRKKYPMKYINKVLLNERQANRRNHRKTNKQSSTN